MKGICFKEPLFYATIEGCKTQTRRLITPQPAPPGPSYRIDDSGILWEQRRYDKEWGGETYEVSHGRINPQCARYKVGDVVYLKEPYFKLGGIMFYKFDKNRSAEIAPYLWKNKLFMPAEAARFFIEITAVRAERLQDITNEDCMKEGIFSDALRCNFGLPNRSRTALDTILGKSFREAYTALIDKINGRGTWDSNPFVWVYEYEFQPLKK